MNSFSIEQGDTTSIKDFIVTEMQKNEEIIKLNYRVIKKNKTYKIDNVKELHEQIEVSGNFRKKEGDSSILISDDCKIIVRIEEFYEKRSDSEVYNGKVQFNLDDDSFSLMDGVYTRKNYDKNKDIKIKINEQNRDDVKIPFVFEDNNYHLQNSLILKKQYCENHNIAYHKLDIVNFYPKNDDEKKLVDDIYDQLKVENIYHIAYHIRKARQDMKKGIVECIKIAGYIANNEEILQSFHNRVRDIQNKIQELNSGVPEFNNLNPNLNNNDNLKIFFSNYNIARFIIDLKEHMYCCGFNNEDTLTQLNLFYCLLNVNDQFPHLDNFVADPQPANELGDQDDLSTFDSEGQGIQLANQELIQQDQQNQIQQNQIQQNQIQQNLNESINDENLENNNQFQNPAINLQQINSNNNVQFNHFQVEDDDYNYNPQVIKSIICQPSNLNR